jgi:hypothetical protein
MLNTVTHFKRDQSHSANQPLFGDDSAESESRIIWIAVYRRESLLSPLVYPVKIVKTGEGEICKRPIRDIEGADVHFDQFDQFLSRKGFQIRHR